MFRAFEHDSTLIFRASFFKILISFWRPACTYEKADKLALNSFNVCLFFKLTQNAALVNLEWKITKYPIQQSQPPRIITVRHTNLG